MSLRHGLAFVCLLLLSFLARPVRADPQATAAALLAAGPDRAAGTPAAAQNAAYLEEQLRQLPAAAGARVFRQSFLMTLPVVEVCRMVPLAAGAAELRVHPLEPMGGQPPNLGAPGSPRELAVVYGGRGRLEDLKGQPLADRLVALEIDAPEGSAGWERCASLGAAGIVFLGGDQAPTMAFLNKSTTLPLGMPRFYCDDPAAVAWFRAARDGPHVAVELVTHWQEKRVANVICVLPGTGADDWLNQWAIVQSRYDAVSPVMNHAPGATSAANAAILLDVARQVAALPVHRTTVLAWTGGDAWNFCGTRAFLDLVAPGNRDAGRMLGQNLEQARARLAAAILIRDESQTNARDYTPGGATHCAAQLDEELLRQSALVEQNLQHARLSDAVVDAAAVERWKADKQELLNADNTVIGRNLAAPATGERNRIQQAAAQVQARWTLEAQRLTEQVAALQNWPDIRAAMPARDPVYFLALALTAGSGAPLDFGLLSRSPYCTGLDVTGPMSSFAQPFRRYGEEGAPRFRADSMDNSVALQSLLPLPLGFSSDAAIARGLPAAAAATLLDPYTRFDSPNDTLTNFYWPVAIAQAQSLTRLLMGPTARPGLLNDPRFYGRANLPSLTSDQTLTVFEHAIGENLPRLKAASALVGGESEIYSHPLGDPLAGTRRADWYLAHADGTVRFASVLRAQEAELRLQAFEFDALGQPVRALAANQSEIHGMIASFYPGDIPRRAMLFDCRRLDAYGLFDPRYLDYLEQIQILDARRLDEAQFSNIYARQGLAAAFLPPQADIRWQLLAARGNVSNRMLVLNTDARHPAGMGFVSTDPAQVGPLPWRAAQDFSALDLQRKADLEKFGISNEVIRELQADSDRQLAAARRAEAVHDYPAFSAASSALWSLQSQEYQNLIDTSNGIINGVIFLLLGVIPFSYFLERLLVGSANVYRQILWFAAIFACMTAGLWFHPAFRISAAPLMILLAFLILILSSTVVYILFGKFEEEIRRLRGSSGEDQHIQSFRRGAVLGAAVRLGLSNMRRRGLRTTLTLVTLVLLTFTLLCFTSVRESVQVSPHEVAYFSRQAAPPAAILLRQRGWQELPIEALELARGMGLPEDPSRRAAPALVAPRWWYASQRAEQPWLLPIQPLGGGAGGRTYLVSGLIGLSPDEARFEPGSPLADLPEGACRLPEKARETLGIKTGDSVLILGFRLRVAGFFSSDGFSQLRQLTGDTFAPLDPAGEKNASASGANQAFRPETSYRFMDGLSVALVPAAITEQLGGRLTSIMLRPADAATESPARIENLANALARRSAFTIYVSTGTHVLSINAAEASRPQDLSTVLVPMIIAGIIVLNTMLGAVAERSREIHVYTSVGLSPTHVGMLFLAEAAALGTLGVVFGYIFGQGLATLLSWTHLMPGVDLNYSSMSAIITMGLVLGIVMLSALWPAWSASRLATPSLHRDWKLPRPVGDILAVDLPFTVNDTAAKGVLAFLAEFLTTTSTAGTGRFTADNLSAAASTGTQGETRALTARIWLAPYDLGVIQSMELSIHPTDQPNVFDVHVQLTREAGNPATWRRLNRPFLVEIRKQFLLWRAVDALLVQAYVEKSAALFGSGNTPA